MINIKHLKINGKIATGLKIDLPQSPPLLLIIGQNGFIMCGFLNIETAEKLNVAAATVSNVKTFSDILETKIKAVTSKAKSMGITVGMNGKDALKHFL